ncbi:hypothetical protein B0A48_04331 [Cryoendolithus antarcticus]|uniref:Transcription elongation factor Eaf N-terminal domain-containing protein n=1 Tax=Cryoendolithus antarcticus TaxID=1507870 RepID=A0A1V8TF20_9PEZI|nr:hypothetical protein B0A48_04331 [Cryoendolithus antarcticus]
MAAAVVSPSIDLTANGSYSIRLGSSLRTESSTAKRRCIRFNYKPDLLSSSNVNSKLSSGSSARPSSTLELSEGAKTWRYAGESREEEDLYVLVLGGGDGKEAVLERVEEVQSLNLVKTPDESDAAKLERRYAHIAADDSTPEHDHVNGDSDDQIDPSNPFDFRHYLTEPLHPSTTGKPNGAASRSTPHLQSSPHLSSTPRSSHLTAASKPQPLKRKAQSSSTPKPTTTKRPKFGPQSSSCQPVPSVRLDRKASLRYPAQDDESDDGELIIENPRGSSKPQSSMHLALSGAFDALPKSKGPISLHEAMSSREASPAVAVEEGEEDGDVEMLELGSPVKGVAEKEGQADADGEDDMERELARAFEEEAESAARAVESDEDISEED